MFPRTSEQATTLYISRQINTDTVLRLYTGFGQKSMPRVATLVL